MNPKLRCMHLNNSRFFFAVALVRSCLKQLTFLETPTRRHIQPFLLHRTKTAYRTADHLRLITQASVRRAGWPALVSFWKVCWTGGEWLYQRLKHWAGEGELSRTVLVLQGCPEVIDFWPAGIKSAKPNLGSSYGETLVVLLVKLPLYIPH